MGRPLIGKRTTHYTVFMNNKPNGGDFNNTRYTPAEAMKKYLLLEHLTQPMM